MARLHAVYMTETEMQGLHSMLTVIRNDARSKPHNTHGQYYQAALTGALVDDLTQRIDARIQQIISKKGTS